MFARMTVCSTPATTPYPVMAADPDPDPDPSLANPKQRADPRSPGRDPDPNPDPGADLTNPGPGPDPDGDPEGDPSRGLVPDPDRFPTDPDRGPGRCRTTGPPRVAPRGRGL